MSLTLRPYQREAVNAVLDAFRAGVKRTLVVHPTGCGKTVVFSSLLGVPLYACGGATIPVMRELSEQGVPAGAILAFLWSGPATRITALAALSSIFRLRHVVLYGVYIVIAAIALGEAVRALGGAGLLSS